MTAEIAGDTFNCANTNQLRCVPLRLRFAMALLIEGEKFQAILLPPSQPKRPPLAECHFLDDNVAEA